VYISIYIQSTNTTNHIRTTTCFGLVTGQSSGCTGHVRRLYNRYRLLFGGQDLILYHRSWGESRISVYLWVCICHLRHVHIQCLTLACRLSQY